jgi:hypothetical protein
MASPILLESVLPFGEVASAFCIVASCAGVKSEAKFVIELAEEICRCRPFFASAAVQRFVNCHELSPILETPNYKLFGRCDPAAMKHNEHARCTVTHDDKLVANCLREAMFIYGGMNYVWVQKNRSFIAGQSLQFGHFRTL